MNRKTVTFRSTRGGVTDATFEDVLLQGMAPDGGLYLPTEWPQLSRSDLGHLHGRPYAAVAAVVADPFVGSAMSLDELAELAVDAYADFRHPAVAPISRLGDDLHLLELFWGPTLSFKDYAMAFLGRAFDHVLSHRGERVTIVGATSGDTGSAAIEALKDRPSVEVIILHPKGRVSDVQRRQMTTVPSANVHNVAIEGSFDDCQALVKAMFADESFRTKHHLSAVNSINFVRIMAQITYYVWATVQLEALDSGIGFAVPSGNFGNIYAGYAARQMGLPVSSLVAANNENHTLNRFFRSGTLTTEDVVHTISPAMDVQVPSNLERLLFDIYEGNGALLGREMERFKERGQLIVPTAPLSEMRWLFDSVWMSDEATKGLIGQVFQESGVVLDPHTAIGVGAARTRQAVPGVPFVAIATAHPAKFPEAVEEATGTRPELPPDLADLFDRPERYETLPNESRHRAAVRGRKG